MLKDTKNQLSIATVSFHWIVALMFIALLIVGLIMEDMPRGPEKFQLMGIHKSIGAIFLVIALARIIYRVVQGFPEELSEKPRWQQIVATSVHHTLLLATVLMPLSGIAMSVGGGRGLDIFGLVILSQGNETEWLSSLGHIVHGILSKIVIAVIVLHSAAAIKQQFVDKTLSRMLGRSV